MNAKTIRRLLLAVALSGAVLTGCVPADAAGTTTGGCDPSGFGPFSGCGDTGSTEQVVEPVAGGCDPNGFGPLSGCGGAEEDTSGQEGSSGLTPDEDVAPEDLAEAAEHEAAHAAVIRGLGGTVDSCEIYTNGDGLTTGSVPGDLMSQLMVFVAGAVETGTDWGSLDDLRQAAQAMSAAGIPPEQRDAMVDEARAKAAVILRARSAEIDRDAADLLEDGELG